MSAYLTATKQAEIAKQLRVPHKAGVLKMVSEIAAAIAAHKAAKVTAIALTPSETYTASELKAVADKLDAVIAALKTAGLMTE